MITTVLIVSLGTSHQPIINCISSLRPDRVVFLCSSESQQVVDRVISEVALPDFVANRDQEVLEQQLAGKLGDAINELDQLDRVYLRALGLFRRIREEHRQCRIIADYTGGTKTMTTGLAMAAIDDGNVELNLTVSNRKRIGQTIDLDFESASEILQSILGQQSSLGKDDKILIKKLRKYLPEFKKMSVNYQQTVISGYSAPVSVVTAAIHARRLQAVELPLLLKRHDYEAARQAVRRVQNVSASGFEASQQLQRMEALLAALDSWDRFDHGKALQVLESLNDPDLRDPLLFPLKRVIWSRQLLDQEARPWPSMPGHGLEVVEDLLRNAERRVRQMRYDDAVGRLYRAMELTEQILLKQGVCQKVGKQGIETGNVRLDSLPAEIQTKWRGRAEHKTDAPNGDFKIGLKDGFDLLGDLGHPTGLVWQQERSKMINALSARNNSLFAHGFQPIGHKGWRDFSGVVVPFLENAISQHAENQGGKNQSFQPLQQLPSRLPKHLWID